MPMRSEIESVVTLPYAREPAAHTLWSRFIAVLSNPDLQIITAFSAIGILLTFVVVLRFPEFGAIVAQLAKF